MMELPAEFIGLFVDEALETLEVWEKCCLKIQNTPDKETYGELFRSAHNLKGSSRSLGMEEFGHVVHQAEEIITCLRDNKIKPDNIIINALLKIQSFLVEWIQELRDNYAYVGDISIAEIIFKTIPNWESILLAKPKQKTEDLPDIDVIVFENSLDVNLENKTTSENKLETGITIESKIEANTSPLKPEKAKNQTSSLRVSAVKLDQLLDSIGELSLQISIIAQAHSLGKLDSPAVKSAIPLCAKLGKEIHTHALSLRMQTLETLFQRLERVLLDLARDEGKKLQIKITGEHVEMDKTVIEKITDPLVHIVRNAIDHGVEKPEKRQLSGKSELACIELNAIQDAYGVQLQIVDDGSGLNKDRIFAKAVEKGLIPEDKKLSDEQIFDLIFLPGFSTAEKITNISGRGVGMDVVRQAVEVLNGKIRIDSHLNKGTTFTISLPTSVNIIEALIIEINNETYAVPLYEIIEIINLNSFKIEYTFDKGKMVNLRSKHVLVENLAEYLQHNLLGKTQNNNEPEKNNFKSALVTAWGNKLIAFEVDKIIAQQSIVKRQLKEQLGSIPFFSGCTIFGDGKPGMILNLNWIANEIANKKQGGKN